MKYLFYVLFRVASSAKQQGGDERTRLLPTGSTASEGSYVDGDGAQGQWPTTWHAGYLPTAGNPTRRILGEVHGPRDVDYGVSTSLWFTVWSSADSSSSRRQRVKTNSILNVCNKVCNEWKQIQFQKCITKCFNQDLFSAYRINFGVTFIQKNKYSGL